MLCSPTQRQETHDAPNAPANDPTHQTPVPRTPVRLNRARLVWLFLALWLALFLWAFIAARGTAPTGDSFLRGINRAGVFFGWQLAALLPGIAAFVTARALPRGMLRRLSCVPVALLGAFVAIILSLILWARLNILLHPSVPHNAPVTAPAAPSAQP
ncbi:MAG: hypothetical protein AAGB05_08410 [Pseudomonadota bacterium]